MELHIFDFDLGGAGAEAYYLEVPKPAAIAIDPAIGPARRRMWELVAEGLFAGVASEHKKRRSGLLSVLGLHGILFQRKSTLAAADRLAVEVLRAMLPEMEPDWILDVLDGRRLADDPRVIAAWCALPIEVVLAALVLEEG